MISSDSSRGLETWKNCEEFARICSLAVHTRLGEGESQPPVVSLAALNRFGYISQDAHQMRPSGQTLSFVTITMFPISATVIRRKLQRSRSARHLLPGDVADLRRAARALLRVRTSFPTADGNARCGRASGSTRQ